MKIVICKRLKIYLLKIIIFVTDDSDLHLQVDKETFLSAKPYHDGAFGYVWAGVRATHGVKFGKVLITIIYYYNKSLLKHLR